MKKILALILALCLLCAVSCAFAETKTMDCGDFTLQYDSAMAITEGEKTSGTVMFTLYPLASEGDIQTNYVAVWVDTKVDLSASIARAAAEAAQSSVEDGYIQVGLKVIEYTILDAWDLVFANKKSACASLKTVVEYSGTNIEIYQWEIMVPGATGTYMLTITSMNQSALEDLSKKLETMILWN